MKTSSKVGRQNKVKIKMQMHVHKTLSKLPKSQRKEESKFFSATYTFVLPERIKHPNSSKAGKV